LKKSKGGVAWALPKATTTKRPRSIREGALSFHVHLQAYTFYPLHNDTFEAGQPAILRKPACLGAVAVPVLLLPLRGKGTQNASPASSIF